MTTNITSRISDTTSTQSTDVATFPHFVENLVADPTPHYERELVMGVLFALWLSTLLMKQILPPLFPKIRTITPARQRQIFTLWPMILLKLTVCYLTIESELSTWSRQPFVSISTKTLQQMHHQTNVFYILVLGYTFELLHRPSPLDFEVHHVCVLLGYLYYRLRFAHVSDVESIDPLTQAATVNLFHLVTIMLIFGVGPVDFASETMRFVYYACDASLLTSNIMRLCVVWTWTARLSQWYVMITHLWINSMSLIEVWGGLEMAICAMFVAYWIFCECLEIVSMMGLSKRYAAAVGMRKKFA